jgi:hypothetical protein
MTTVLVLVRAVRADFSAFSAFLALRKMPPTGSPVAGCAAGRRARAATMLARLVRLGIGSGTVANYGLVSPPGPAGARRSPVRFVWSTK